MADELSQAERTARETAAKADGFGEPARRRAWQAGRDYGRERERTLEAALDFLADAERLDISQATVARFAHAILASPGEPEGQLATIPGYANGGNLQPDHGPGEPSEDTERPDEVPQTAREMVDRIK